MAEKSTRGAAMPAPPKPQDVVPSVESAQVEITETAPKAPVSTRGSSGPIQVVATRPGFYGQVRRVEGDKFTIPNESHMGEWMKKI